MRTNQVRPPEFIFLEFLDSEVNALLTGLRSEFGCGDASSRIHITLRGPYLSGVPREDMERCERVVNREPILINGVGAFTNGNLNVVYLKIVGRLLSRIWWKPDYPPGKCGINPHITMMESYDLGLARRVRDFLVAEDIRLLVSKMRVVPYSSRQSELFHQDPIPLERHFLSLANRRLVRPDILQRAANLMLEYKAVTKENDQDA